MMLLRAQLQMWEDLLTDYQLKSRMTGDCHVRFREGLGGKFPRSTRLTPSVWLIDYVELVPINRDSVGFAELRSH